MSAIGNAAVSIGSTRHSVSLSVLLLTQTPPKPTCRLRLKRRGLLFHFPRCERSTNVGGEESCLAMVGYHLNMKAVSTWYSVRLYMPANTGGDKKKGRGDYLKAGKPINTIIPIACLHLNDTLTAWTINWKLELLCQLGRQCRRRQSRVRVAETERTLACRARYFNGEHNWNGFIAFINPDGGTENVLQLLTSDTSEYQGRQGQILVRI
ncbi:hypothetical protein N657DRAFT_505032 [Parathielavia appendiculata]|uniref:Uncharacterized protein n=1 Tax=Parathielavia appendiculata TaxID=2587402 RepID=A0AAN6TXF4_9PEZI|nr:hypothetical protein N657DRAFT_505032 [Parathielavia appendiculata]